MPIFEVCVDSIESAMNAFKGGANRIELCSALSEGGLTPSIGLFRATRKVLPDSKIFCMIRIRRGNFCYSDYEIEAMIADIKYFKEHGADGIVFGCLTDYSDIDIPKCQQLINAWGPGSKNITFHRAFDITEKTKYEENIKTLATLGFNRILSSGFEQTALRGIDNLKKIVSFSETLGVTVIPGSGINDNNLETILKETHCKEFHASARSKKAQSSMQISMGSNDDLQQLMICDALKVQELIAISNRI